MTRDYLDRFEDILCSRNIPHLRYGGNLWTVYQRMIVPVGPVSTRYELSAADARALLKRLPGVMVRWTDGIGNTTSSQWYSVICDTFQDVSQIASAKTRSRIRRSLKHCRVERVSAEEILRLGYGVFFEAYSRYTNKTSVPISEKAFMAETSKDIDFGDIIEYWGVYIQDKLAAYARNSIFSTEGVDYNTIKFGKEASRREASYALVYTMNQYYLTERNVNFVNDGFCSILHTTQFQENLIRKSNFHKVPHALHIHYRPIVGLLVNATFPVRQWIGKCDERIASLLKQEEICRLGSIGHEPTIQ